MTEPDRPTTPRREQARRVVLALVAVYVVVFVVLNTNRVKINFVFTTVRTWTLVALAVVAALSFGAGYLVRGRRMRGR